MQGYLSAGSDDFSDRDADLRFQALVREPRIAIILTTAVLLTAIIWITTFLATVSSAAAYLSQVAAAPAPEDAVRQIVTPLSFPLTALTITAMQHKDMPVDEPLQTSAGAQHVAATKRVASMSTAPQASAEASTAAATAMPQIIDARAETATIAPARVAQDHATSIAQVSVPESGRAQTPTPESQCGDGFWGNVCRERVRWSHCHPDKWDMTPECVVQKFDSAYSLQ